MNLLVVFLTGLTTGGLSCLAMQGGLLASVIANQKNQERKESNNLKGQPDWLPVLMFLGTKLVAHTILGFFLGLLGSVITLSLGVQLTFQVFTALFMFATAMNLLNVHPIFRYVVFQPPKFIQRRVKNTSKSDALFAPGLLGLMTIFIPCGITQAMEVVAINSGNPIWGALIMFAFVLGTSPLFALLGVTTAKLSEGWYQRFTKIAAYSLVAMTIYGLNGVLVVVDSPITLNKIASPITYFFSDQRFSNTPDTSTTVNGVQQVTIGIFNNGYNPKNIKVKSGQPVELTLESKDTYSCALSFVFKEFGIKTFLESTDSKTFTFTPTKKGKYTFTCSMGMYSGTMEVI
jgi:sulfite exporter TauE/SafE/plastocyanin